MVFGLDKLFKEGTRDSMIFQVCEDFVEVGVVRMLDGEDACGTHPVEQMYTSRLPRVKQSTKKKVFDDLARQIEKLADTIMTADELKSRDFAIGDAKIICILVEPLTVSADVVYSTKLKKQTKITTELLRGVLKKGEITKDDTENVAGEYAVYAEELSGVRLNGYDTNRPLGKRATEVDITIVKQMTTKEVWGAVGNVLERTFNRDVIYIHKPGVIELDDAGLCAEIYTATELQAIANDIL